MPSFVSLCLSVFVLTFVMFTNSCNEKAHLRFISDTDTSFSKDIRNISQKINENPNVAELYYKRSNAFFFEDNFSQAILDINHALHLDSINPLYYFKKGKYLMSGDTANAILAENCYISALKYKPDFIDALSSLALIYMAKQKYTQSEELYVRMNKLDPSNPDAYFYLGMIAKEKRDTVKAVNLFEKVLLYDGQYYNAIMQLGNLYAVKKDKKALMFFDRAIQINEFSYEAYYAKGLYLQQRNLYRDASAMYETVARMNPAHVLCRYNLAYINGLFENFEKGISLLDEVIDLAPDYADAYSLRGKMKENLKNSTGAYNDYKMALAIDENQILASEGLKRINITISMP